MRKIREKEFCDIKSQIISLLEKLETEPNTTFEREIICEDVDKVILGEKTMDNTKHVLERLQLEINSNTTMAKDIIERMQDIAQKLKVPCDVIYNSDNFYSSKFITQVNF